MSVASADNFFCATAWYLANQTYTPIYMYPFLHSHIYIYMCVCVCLFNLQCGWIFYCFETPCYSPLHFCVWARLMRRNWLSLNCHASCWRVYISQLTVSLLREARLVSCSKLIQYLTNTYLFCITPHGTNEWMGYVKKSGYFNIKMLLTGIRVVVHVIKMRRSPHLHKIPAPGTMMISCW